jgi:hypothetical protein
MNGGRRRWNEWFGRTTSELNGVAGLTGVGGIAMGTASLVAGGAAVAFLGIGGVLVVASIGYAAVKGFPPKVRTPHDAVGTTIPADELRHLSPPILTWSIVGLTKAGKSTLRARLAFEPPPTGRTQNITAYIAASPALVAVLDGGGDKYPQQFKIAELCSCLCILIDHNESDTDNNIDDDRLKTHAAFLQQIRHHLDEYNPSRKLELCFLINKRDLWQTAPPQQINKFETFYRAEVDKWRHPDRATTIEVHPYSNGAAHDINILASIIRRSVSG